MGTGSFPEVKRPGRGVDHPPHVAPRLKKEYSYTSPAPLVFRGLFYGELEVFFGYFYLKLSAEVKERVELYLYSPSCPSWPVLG